MDYLVCSSFLCYNIVNFCAEFIYKGVNNAN